MNKDKKENIWDNYGEKDYMSLELLNYKILYFNKLFDNFDCDKNELVIEIGAGHGISSQVFSQIFSNYIVTEPNKYLFEKLTELKNSDEKYTNMTLYQTCLEELNLDNISINEKVNLVIFSYSFQYIEYNKCFDKLDEILKVNGFLLIMLPFKPFVLNEEFDDIKNKKWRKQINQSINNIIRNEQYELLMLEKEKNYIILLKKII